MNLLDPSLWWVFALIAIGAVIATIVINWAYKKTTIDETDSPEEGVWVSFPRKRKRD